jgi:hypothetical protein
VELKAGPFNEDKEEFPPPHLTTVDIEVGVVVVVVVVLVLFIVIYFNTFIL